MASGGHGLRAVITVLATAALAAGALVSGATAANAADPLPKPPPLLQRDDSVVTGDPLPTVQIDSGYVWSQTTIGTTVYAVGQFANARAALAAPGTSLTSRSNILAFDINTGELLPFAPAVNGSIKAVAASPDGSRIYIGGSFNSVNGQTRWNIAALDARTGELVPGFSPSVGGNGVFALAADADAVYAGGLFTQANGTARKNLAAFAASNGALRTDWDSQPDQQVDAMALDPDGAHVIVGGRFADVDGDGRWRGLVSIAKSTGEVNANWAGTQKVKNGWATGSSRGKAGIFALNVDDHAVYGTGWVFASAEVGNVEGVFSLEPASGTTRWLADCLGDHYGVYSTGSVVYSTTHTHACSTMGLWPEQSPRTHKFVHAMTADVRGTLGNQPHAGGTYVNWEGEPAPAAYAWYPDFFTGTATGLNQAGLSITGKGNVISIAGEFPGVNNRYFQGIVRFSTTPPGGAKDGPRTTTAAWGAPSASTVVPGRIRVSITGTWDRDDRDLTYELTRTGTTGAIDTVAKSNGWWNLPTVNLVDTTVQAGQSYTYRVTVKDGDGNAVTSQPVTATASTEAAMAYTSAVIEDGASLYYPMGITNADWAGNNPPVLGTGVQTQQPGAVIGSSTGFSNFSGSTTGRVSTANRPATPADFTTELWFKTTTNRGGKLIGYGNAQTGSSSSYDRHIYMRNDGRLNFGVYPGTTKVVTSASSYNDGQWHHVAASLSGDGMKLYVDGQAVASDPSVTNGEGFTGYWRIGGDNLNSWPNQPSSDWFSGSIDEVAVYPQALSAAQVATHYAIGTGREVPTASFTATADELSVDFDGSGSTVSGGGSIVDYSWNFGDGSPTVSGASATRSHAYTETGTYTVTLTVRDNHGLVGVAEQQVSVLGPNTPPTAAFEASASGLGLTVDGSASSDADGSIESFAWDWGDDSEPGTGALATHVYGAAGSYTVTLTVTDDRGGTATETRQVEATHAAPVASFEASSSGLTVDTDAGGTTASDGATLSYSWDWGDSSPASSGAQASHTYAEDGSYEITLTATDSLGATAEFTRTVAVEATVYTVLDDFDRTVSGGWGAAPTGGVWTTMSGSATAASVDGGHGLLSIAPGGTRQMAAQSVSLADSESVLDYRTDFGPSSGTGYVGMSLRQSATDRYTIHAWHRNNGTVWLVAQRGSTVLATQAISGLSWAQGDEFTIKTEVSGSNPTTLRGKIWKRGATEPQSWQLSTTDSSAGLQQAGYVSVRYNLGSASTSAGAVAFDRVSVRDLDDTAPAANVPPVADFTATASGLSVAVDASASTDSDGTIASYTWDWGDGSPAGTGVTATHPYAAAGQYDVTLTIADDDGATHSSTQRVAVSAPAENAPPAADFTATASGLSVAVDASASTDSDGTIASYTWDWGDGSPAGTGVTATHPYAAAGQYTVTLTVADDDGATATTSREVAVAAPPAEGFLIQDDFERSATASWGTADLGGAWTIGSGAASAASVSDGKARMMLAPSGTRTALLTQTPALDFELTADFSVDSAPTDGATYVGTVGRHTGSTYYMVNAWLRTDGRIWLVAQRGGTTIATYAVPNLVYAAGDELSIRVAFEGSGTTQLRGKIWKSAEAEPSGWQLTADDSTPELQGAGSAGFRINRTSTATTPVTVSLDALRVSAIG